MEIRLRREALQEYILRRNLSQNGFALKAKVSTSYMAQLLAGTRKPSGRIRQKIMEATGLGFDELFQVILFAPERKEKKEEEYARLA